MALLKKEQFEKLAAAHSAHCYSIFLPTRRYGEEVLKGEDAIRFKRLLSKVRDSFQEHGVAPRQVEKLLEPARALLDDGGFWRNLSDGLAVFGSEGAFHYFTLPLPFRADHYIGDHFFVKPLIPLFNGDGRFFILQLTLHGASMYEGTRHTVSEVYIEDLTPARLEEVVGYDFEEKSLQFRTQEGGKGGAQFHGHGGADNKHKDEVLQYCRAVDKGLMQMLHDEDAPLVVSSVDYVFPLYKEVSRYRNILDKNLSPQADPGDLTLLHERAWERVAPGFDAKRDQKAGQYQDLSATSKTSYDPDEIVPAAVNGRIDTLFLREDRELYGLYVPAEQELERQEEKTLANASLGNLAAVHTLRQGGDVFLMRAEDMPDADTDMNALFRY